MQKILSISIAAYNVEKYIRKALDSLIDEGSMAELEIFVVDDGGTDHTLEIAQEYADKYPDSIFPIHKENGGYGSTINFSIEKATGKYFKQLDGDDWYQTENLKDLIKILRTTSADCILTDFVNFYEADCKSVYRNVYPYIADGEYQLTNSGIKGRLRMYSSAFRTEILKNMPYRLSEHCFYTDIEYSALPIPYIQTLYVLHKPIYVYRIGTEGQSMNVDGIARHYKEHESVFWRLLKIYNTVSEDNKINKIIFWDLLENRLKEHYLFLCLIKTSKSSKKELIAFDQKVNKECPNLLEAVLKDSKLVKLLRRSHFCLYSFLSRMYQRRWRR